MLPRLRRPIGLALAAGLALALLPAVAHAQVVVKVNDTVNFRLGFQLQGWGEYLQDPISEGYQQSFCPSYIGQLRLNFSRNSSCHWAQTFFGARIRMRSAFLASHACRSSSPASMVFPSPTSSAISSLGGQLSYMRWKACT